MEVCMNINFNGYDENSVTMLADSTLKDGVQNVLVTVGANGTATIGKVNKPFLGVCTCVRDGYATVQTRGYCKVNTTAKLSLGGVTLASTSDGKAVENTAGKMYFVLDSTDNEAGILL